MEKKIENGFWLPASDPLPESDSDIAEAGEAALKVEVAAVDAAAVRAAPCSVGVAPAETIFGAAGCDAARALTISGGRFPRAGPAALLP